MTPIDILTEAMILGSRAANSATLNGIDDFVNTEEFDQLEELIEESPEAVQMEAKYLFQNKFETTLTAINYGQDDS